MIYESIKYSLTNWAIGMGVPEGFAVYTTDAIVLVALALFAKGSFIIAKHLHHIILKLLVEKSGPRWDDVLYKKKFFSRLAHLVPALLIFKLAPALIIDIPLLAVFIAVVAKLYGIIMLTLATFSIIDAFYEIYQSTKLSSKIAIKGFLQAGKLVLILVSVLLILSVLTDKTPIYFLSGLGALTAVLLLIFKDAILGLVAGVQLSANEMVREGDWIEMPQFGADGDVIDVSLTTFKVQNWDKTITTIPTYALISQSFKNWRGMQESEGRRIKRSMIIDMSSIKFCDQSLLERLSKVRFLKDYIKERTKEIHQYNAEHGGVGDSPINGRQMTNVGTFRKYIEQYLHHHPKIHQSMTFLVRQLQPTDKGLPIEIYVFSKIQEWAAYEALQSDIFDHLLASIHEFDLRVFQSPSGADFNTLTGQTKGNQSKGSQSPNDQPLTGQPPRG